MSHRVEPPLPVMAIPRSQAPVLPPQGCWAVEHLDFFHPPQWKARDDIEHDETLLQPIAYVVLRNGEGRLWCYARRGGDDRIDGRMSCGVGGHVDLTDSAPAIPATLLNAARRELAEELGPGNPARLREQASALLYEGHSAIGRVHLGVLFVADWPDERPPQPPAHEKLAAIGFLSPAEIGGNPQFELWSRLAARYLQDMQ